jgi:hypothetical protein
VDVLAKLQTIFPQRQATLLIHCLTVLEKAQEVLMRQPISPLLIFLPIGSNKIRAPTGAFLLTDRAGIDTKKTSACHGIAKD